MSRIRQRINQFDIELTIYPEIKQQILDLTDTILTIIENSEEDKAYLHELLHQLTITYNILQITTTDAEKYEKSETQSE